MTDPPAVTKNEGEGTYPPPGGWGLDESRTMAWGRLVAGLVAAGVEVEVVAGLGSDRAGARWLRLTWDGSRLRAVEVWPMGGDLSASSNFGLSWGPLPSTSGSAGRRRGRPAGQVDAERVKRLRAAGLSVRAVARECGISTSTVQRIVSRVEASIG